MAKPNVFTAGIWTPVASETTHDGALPVRGSIPTDIAGSFVRIGPNPRKAVDDGYHLFLGDGMIHCFEIAGGRASYRNRWVRTERFRTGRNMAGWRRTGLANTAMVHHAGQLLALEEGGKPHAVTLPHLETVGVHTYGGKLRHNFTAHPKVCPKTGEMMFFGYGPHKVEGSPPGALHYAVVSAGGELLRSVPVVFRRPVMTHDMAITRNYSIMLDFPLWDMREAVSEADPSRFGVMPRHATSPDQIQWFEAPGQYGYHVANAWESDDGSQIELVMISAKGFNFKRANDDKLLLHRWVFDLASGKTVVSEDLCELGCEFPVIHRDLHGSKSRYVWAAKFARGSDQPVASDGILKYDHETRTVKVHRYPSNLLGGEPAFVPRRGATAEDDGYLLVVCNDKDAMRSELRVIDARTMADVPIASVDAPGWVCAGFHATFVPREDYAAGAAKL